MILKWLKNILTKKEKKGISKINTDFVNIPKYSELSEYYKKIVKSYINEISLDNYETVIKYSELLSNKNNQDIMFLYNKISKLESLIDSIKLVNEIKKNKLFNKTENKNDDLYRKYYTDTLVEIDYLREQIKHLIIDIKDTEIKSELRLIAFNEFIKKESKRKYDFLGIFGSAERVKYLQHKNLLINEKERLLIMVKMIRDNIYSASFATEKCDYNEKINEIQHFINYYDYKKDNPSIETDYASLKQRYDIEKKITSEINKLKEVIECIKDNNNNNNNIDLYNLYDSLKINYRAILTYHGKDYFKTLKSIAKVKIMLDKYAYINKDAYKKIKEEVDELSLKYSKTTTNNFNIKELEALIQKYLKISTNYAIICSEFTNEKILKELRESLFGLNYYYQMLPIKNYKGEYKTRLGKSLILNDYTNQIIGKAKKYNPLWNWEYSDEREYYDSLSSDLLKKIYAQLPPQDKEYLDNDIRKIIKSCENTNQLFLLRDIYNNDYSNIDLSLAEKNYINFFKTGPCSIGLFYDLNKIIKNLYLKRKNNINKCFISENIQKISLLDFYHYLKFLGINDSSYKKILFDEKYKTDRGVNSELKKIIIAKIFDEIHKNDDNRILIIPKIVGFDCNNPGNNFNHLNYTSNIKAVMFTDCSQFSAITKLYQKNPFIKYIFINKKNLNQFYDYLDNIKNVKKKNFQYTINTGYGSKKIEIIPLPNNTSYFELQGYLDEKLEKCKTLTKK